MAASFVVALEQMPGRDANLADFALLVLSFARGFVRLECRDFMGTAFQTANAFRPSSGGNISQALFIGAELLLYFYQA
jgi:hypothetical protein